MKARDCFKMSAAAVLSVLVLTGCGDGDNSNNVAGSGGGGGSYTYTGRTVRIGTQTWMAENLDRATSGSVCYDSSAGNCAKYGRLYTYNAARTACPAGWHLPSDAEWGTLIGFIDSHGRTDYPNNAGTKLKSSSGWYDNGNGTDAHGFSALPGGIGAPYGNFSYPGIIGYWWSATEDGASSAWARDMYYGSEFVAKGSLDKSFLISVRCLQNVRQ